ncbi:hypothetical protein T01_11654, partial [Trichinella spiralis]
MPIFHYLQPRPEEVWVSSSRRPQVQRLLSSTPTPSGSPFIISTHTSCGRPHKQV